VQLDEARAERGRLEGQLRDTETRSREIAARLSHLPQLASVAMVNATMRSEAARSLRLAGPAFVQMSRLAELGKKLYSNKYGCNGCHGDSGLGQYDLRKGPAKYPTDDELIAWIRYPERLRPGIAMPTWDGVIQEEEYAPLVAYVRSLAPAAKTP